MLRPSNLSSFKVKKIDKKFIICPAPQKIVSHNKNIDSVRYASHNRIDSTPPFNTFMNILDTKPSDHRRGYWKYSVGSTFNFIGITIFSFIGYLKLKNNDQTYSKTVKVHS